MENDFTIDAYFTADRARAYTHKERIIEKKMKWIVLKQADWWLVFSWCVCDFYFFCPGLFQKNMALKCIWASKSFKNYNTETYIKTREIEKEREREKHCLLLNQHCVDSYCLFFIVAFCVSFASFYFSNWSKWIQKYKSFVKLMILIYQYHKSKINNCAISNGSRQVFFYSLLSFVAALYIPEWV